MLKAQALGLACPLQVMRRETYLPRRRQLLPDRRRRGTAHRGRPGLQRARRRRRPRRHRDDLQDRPQAHLAEADARKLLSDALAEYRRIHGRHPARIVLHKTSQFSPAEVAGFQGAADEREIDFLELIWILSRSETRSHAVRWGFARDR
jgi:hypothetical protein